MQIVLATDIFGLTSHVEVLAAHLRQKGQLSEIFSPFAGLQFFTDEGQAYQSFLQAGGIEAYSEKIAAGLQAVESPQVCIGFSAGAAALWRVQAQPGADNIERAILFYGSQIRDTAELQPQCETLLVFPAEEPHFSVPELIKRLQGRPGITCTQVPWQHGYMNRLSRNFEPEGYRRTLAWLDGQLGRPGRNRAVEDSSLLT